MQFERGPWRVSQATGGREGLELMRTQPGIDCVLVDLNMPEMNGVEFIAAARAEPALARVPIVVLTAAGQIGQVEEARERGAAAIITKPFSPKKLYRQLAELLGDDPDAELGGEG